MRVLTGMWTAVAQELCAALVNVIEVAQQLKRNERIDP